MPHTQIASSEQMLDELAGWVRLETPTTDAAAVNRLMDVAQGELARAGALLERVWGRDGYGDTLVARTPGDGRPIVVAGHLDTVWSTGTLATMPYRVDGHAAYGPGIFDMKAGSYIALHVVRAMLMQKVRTPRPVVLLLTPDEEVGSPTSRAIIEREGGQAEAVLIVEPAGASGACVTARKGVGGFKLLVRGIGSHAGSAFEQGASAIVELAEQIRRLHGMVDIARGITLNVAPVWGGTRPNVVPEEAGCRIDLRVPTIAAGERMTQAILGLEPVDRRCTLTITGGMSRPPFAETPGISALYERARALAEPLGIALPKSHRGGGSDGNFTAALGVPTLDGLGCPGRGAHATHEQIQWRQLAPRAALLASLIETME